MHSNLQLPNENQLKNPGIKFHFQKFTFLGQAASSTPPGSKVSVCAPHRGRGTTPHAPGHFSLLQQGALICPLSFLLIPVTHPKFLEGSREVAGCSLTCAPRPPPLQHRQPRVGCPHTNNRTTQAETQGQKCARGTLFSLCKQDRVGCKDQT